jgi:hypothetical protein
VAVNVTLVPWQTEVEGLADMLTLAVTFGLTVMITVLEFAEPVVRQLALLVMVQLI